MFLKRALGLVVRPLYCCFTAALLLLYFFLTGALLVLYWCFTGALLVLYCKCRPSNAFGNVVWAW
jgi:hypothetical protein